MTPQRLRELIPLPEGQDLDKVLQKYVAEHGHDLPGFIAWLHARGVLTAGQVRDVLSALEVTVSDVSALRRPAGGTRHQQVALLGKGAMGEVLIARDRDLERTVAVKRMAPHLAESATGVGRFLTEVQITAQLEHPGVIPVYGLERGDTPSYSMKLVQGRNLDQFLEDTREFYRKKLPPDANHSLPARLELFVRVCDAMAYAHSRGVIHRDLKPENIMIGPFGEVYVMDWGCARLIGGTEVISLDGLLVEERPNLTRFGSSVGTPAYMSPEQAKGHNDELDGRSDQCMLGLVLFEIVSLKWAITGKTGAEVLARAADGDKDPLVHQFGETIPRELAAIVAKSTAARPEARYPDVGALAADLRRFMRNEEIAARPDGALQRAQRWISQHRELTLSAMFALVFALFAGGTLAIVGTVAALAWQEQRAQAREERLSDMLAVVTTKAHEIDAEFQGYESLLAGLASTAEYALTHAPDQERTAYLNSGYDQGIAPPDLVDSLRYRQKISLGSPDHMVATGVDPAGLATQIQQFEALSSTMYETLARSAGAGFLASPAADQRLRITSSGLPLVWTYVATEDGLISSMPGGHSLYPVPYDPREQPWYLSVAGRRGPVWSPAQIDESGMGLLVTCAQGLYVPNDRFRGVAAVDVSIDHITPRLEPDLLGVELEAWLLDKDGKTVLNSRMKSADEDAPPFPFADVVEKARMIKSKHIFRDLDGERKLILWSHLDAVDWTYLVVGDADELLAE